MFTYNIVDLDIIFQELLPILSQISLPWQPGSVVAEFVWRHSIARSQNPPRRKYLSDISNKSWDIAHFVSNDVAMATRVGRGLVVFVWHYSIALPQKPRVGRKDLLYISYTSRVISNFVSNFVAMAMGLVAVEFVWRHSIARPQKPLLYANISGISLI